MASGFASGTLVANINKNVPSIGYIAHLDTANYEAAGVHPVIHENYDGTPIHFDNGLELTVDQFPELRRYFGETLISSDGTTLLGVDDKAGIAGAIGAVRYLIAHPEVKHGEIKLAFGPDEEIGTGADRFDVASFATDFAYTLDNGDLGQIEYETFNAAQATLEIQGVSVHPGNAKDLLINALSIARDFDNALPKYERPEYTEGHQGYFHLNSVHGNTDHATVVYTIRDHDKELFDARKATFQQIAETLNAQFDTLRITIAMHDQYYNGASAIQKNPQILALAEAGIKAVGLTPSIIPFRGGTDGSKITYLGLPTPNLFNGGINFHGPYEVVSTEAIGKLAETLVAIASLNVEQSE
ncbi:tripeptide aminopeptidase [Lacticaseibacillus manihotivorans DSM 13343 = JCM 12514]|uniref:Peptidase T n=2 Tax=Lacticaseibacillus manihotivorans TaxID=88233 RepID=A0A0R1R7Z5_9LACO|nr:tripeptide aminopeptidase [Lacticaseibacillus manihotivorans DSM 13343 = JCM 12514]